MAIAVDREHGGTARAVIAMNDEGGREQSLPLWGNAGRRQARCRSTLAIGEQLEGRLDGVDATRHRGGESRLGPKQLGPRGLEQMVRKAANAALEADPTACAVGSVGCGGAE